MEYSLERVLDLAHGRNKRELEDISSKPEIDFGRLKKVHLAAYALMGEAKLHSQEKHDEYKAYYDSALTQLRIRARAQVLGYIKDLNSLGDSPIDESLLDQRLHPSAVQNWEKIVPAGILERIRPLVGTYATSSTISEIAGYPYRTFNYRVKGHKLEKKGTAYLIDQNSIPIFFSPRRVTVNADESKSLGDGHSDDNGDLIDFNELLVLARPIFGDRSTEEVPRIIDEQGARLEVEDGRFSRKRFERILKRENH